MFIKTRGTRGSCSTVQYNKLEYGGNTICFEVIQDYPEFIIIDAGTGIVQLGNELPDEGILHLFISHWHLDHVCGLSFLKALHNPKWKIHLYLPKGQHQLLDTFFNGIFFPLKAEHLRCQLTVHELSEEKKVEIGSITIESPLVPHVGVCHGFVLTDSDASNSSIAILTDVEISPEKIEETNKVKKILKNVSIAFVDAYFTEDEYYDHIGWGHTAMGFWFEVVKDTAVKHIVCTHHNIHRTDTELDTLAREFSNLSQIYDVKLSFAKENLRYNPEFPTEILDFVPIVNTLEWLNNFSHELLKYTDTYIILDRILYEARRMSFAEAGTVYLVEGNELVFAYTHNDKLFPADKSSKYAYSNTRIPIATNSIAGYCAYTKQSLSLHDVRNFPSDYPFYFNEAFDKATNYHTVSVYCMPLLGHSGQLLGVLQLINRKERGESVPFPNTLDLHIDILSTLAVNAIERAKLVEEMVLRLQRIVTLHDPSETGAHVERVSAVTAELYTYIAETLDLDVDQRHTIRGQIRLAAKLHDVGKVGVPKEILKKPGKLTAEEYKIMQKHAYLGGEIFKSTLDTTDDLAKSIATHHHQKWDGTGYVGSDEYDILSGENIPLEARIVAVADVFDALISKRCYKDEWTWEDAIDLLKQSSGSHFDPEVVQAFLDIEDTVKVIYETFKDEENDDMK